MTSFFRAAALAITFLVPIDSALAALPDPIARIPFELRSGLPTVKVTIGDKVIPLFIDLGGYSPIALTYAALLNAPVKYSGVSDKWKDATGAIHESKRFAAPNVTIAGTSFGDLQGGEFSFPEGRDEADPKGYIGFGILKNYLLVFDYPANMLRLYPSGDLRAMAAECGDKQFPLQVANGVLQTVIDTNKGKLIFQWDTGSTLSILRPSSISEPGKYLQSFNKFMIGERQFAPMVFELREFGAPAVDGVLGTDFFQSRVICLDVKTSVGAVR